MPLPPLLAACRPLHAAKNLLILVPLAAGHCADGAQWFAAGLGVAAFSMAAAGGYLLNDWRDAAHDRTHPEKRMRPLAAGTLGWRTALGLAGGLIGAAIVLSMRVSHALALCVVAYCVLTLLYSLLLRRLAGLDLLVIAAFFVLRVVAGGAATGIWPSAWLLAFVGTLALALACAKRHAELARLAGDGARGSAGGSASAGLDGRTSNRPAEADPPALPRHSNPPCPVNGHQAPGRGWWTGHRRLLEVLLATTALAAVSVLGAYAGSDAATLLYPHPWRLLGAPALLAVWLLRLFQLTRQGKMREDPLVFALTDGAAWLTLAGMAACFYFAR